MPTWRRKISWGIDPRRKNNKLKSTESVRNNIPQRRIPKVVNSY